MVTLGVDAHKRSHSLVAVDDAGRQLGAHTVAAISAGHLEALRWARRWREHRWAVEDCRHVTRNLEKDLLSAGEVVVRVPPQVAADGRRSLRERGKSDPIDALAVARAALRESFLPEAHLDDRSRSVKLLLDHREDLVGERTRIQNRLQWLLHELEPEFQVANGALSRRPAIRRVEALLQERTGVVAELARELTTRTAQLSLRIDELEQQLALVMPTLAPSLLALPGCGVLTAAKLVGETADARRFRSRAAFAMHNGTAPIPASSGNQQRHRLNRGGNRQLNAALHRIAVSQIRGQGRSHDYFQHRLAAGSTKREAYRALRRRLSDEVFRLMLIDLRQARSAQSAAA
jgi:transposase